MLADGARSEALLSSGHWGQTFVIEQRGMSDNQDTTQNPDQPDGGSLEQIRSILFGAESQQIQHRFNQLHDEMSEALGGLRALVKDRTDSIAAKLEGDLRQLREQVTAMEQAFTQKNSELDEKFQYSANDLRQHLGALSETLSAAERTLRSESERNVNQAKDEMLGQLNTLRADVQRDVSSVSGATVSRRMFSDALRELSERFADNGQ